MTQRSEAQAIMARIEVAERMAPAGTHEHVEFVKTALFCEWSRIKAILTLTAGNCQDG